MSRNIFLCHAEEDLERVRSLRDQLFKQFDQELHVWWPEDLLPGHDIKLETFDSLEKSDRVLICLTRQAFKKAGAHQQLLKMVETLRQCQPERKIFAIPVMLEELEEGDIPRVLHGLEPARIYQEGGTEKLIKALSSELQANTGAGSGPSQTSASPPEQPAQVLANPLTPTQDAFFDRNDAIRFLNEAWSDPGKAIASIIASGGMGKTALLHTWLMDLRQCNYNGARVFIWSFSSGTESLDLFFDEAIEFISGASPDNGRKKSILLAQLMAKSKTLMILDDFETLQHAGTSHSIIGSLMDQAMSEFLNEFALSPSNPSLCVITSHLAVTGLKSFETSNGSACKYRLPPLPDEEAIEILRHEGVQEKQLGGASLESLVQKFGGHPLTLWLLATVLIKSEEGDLSRIHDAKLLESYSNYKRAHALLKTYEAWLRDRYEFKILLLLTLFDRPVKPALLKKLKSLRSDILFTQKVDIHSRQGRFALEKLCDLKLLIMDQDGRYTCHPLIREFFEERFKELDENAWKKAHNILFDYYKELNVPTDCTLNDLKPLFFAISHGCKAERYKEALHDVYRAKVTRGNEFFATRAFGCFRLEIGALANFFDKLWDEPVEDLSETDQVLVLRSAGFNLLMTGCYKKAIKAMTQALAIARSDDYDNITLTARNLANAYIMHGDFDRAVETVEEYMSAAYADPGGWMPIGFMCSAGDALRRMGHKEKALKYFLRAEAHHHKVFPEEKYLNGLPGYHYCQMLLDIGSFGEVEKRTIYTRQLAGKQKWSANVAMDELSLARAMLARHEHEDFYTPDQIEEQIQRSIASLKAASRRDKLPIAYLTRARFIYRTDFPEAEALLDLALEIADDLHLESEKVEVLLERMRIYDALLAENHQHLHLSQENVRLTLSELEKLITDMGYYRHKDELLSFQEKFPDRPSFAPTS